MVRYKRGNFSIEKFQKKVSTAFAMNDMVTIDVNGFLDKSNATSARVLGLIQKTIASTDSDYASATEVPVLLPESNTIFEFDVSTGTVAQTDVGELVDLDDENSIDVVDSTFDIVEVTKMLSTTKVEGRFSIKSGAAG